MSHSRILLFSCLIFLLAGCGRGGDGGAREIVQNFYESYLNYNYHKTPDIPVPKIAFSKSFESELAMNWDLCSRHPDDICGFGSDGDPYMDAQDFDSNLTAEKAGLQVLELENGLIQVQFNLFPAGENGSRVIHYKMINENGVWVVDDIIYPGDKSARELMKQENELNLK